MKVNREELSEVVVTGMFNRRKEGFTGSAVTVKGEELKKISTTNIAKALAAIDPSFRVMEDIENGSNPNRLPDLRMRGQATLPGGNAGASANVVTLQGEYATYPNQPLLIMDGFRNRFADDGGFGSGPGGVYHVVERCRRQRLFTGL